MSSQATVCNLTLALGRAQSKFSGTALRHTDSPNAAISHEIGILFPSSSDEDKIL
jgi:hypothetical protein